MIVIVGTFTTPERRGAAQGLRSYLIKPDGWDLVQELPGTNPSYLVRHPVHDDVIYTCHSDDRKVSAVRVGQDGRMEWIGESATGGYNGAHLAVSPDGRGLVVANFSSGSISVFPLDADGIPHAECDVIELGGATGPLAMQTGSQPHQVMFSRSGRYFLVPDRGCDVVHVFSYESPRKVRALAGAAMAPGSGPRHMEWHPDRPIGYVLNELDCSLAACRWDESRGRLEPGPGVPTRPPGVTKESIAAAVCVSRNGRFVYTTTRGHDCVTVFDAGEDGVSLKPIDSMEDIGHFPRFMEMDASREALWLTSNRSGDIIRISIDPNTGKLGKADRVRSPSPTCLLFMHSRRHP